MANRSLSIKDIISCLKQKDYNIFTLENTFVDLNFKIKKIILNDKNCSFDLTKNIINGLSLEDKYDLLIDKKKRCNQCILEILSYDLCEDIRANVASHYNSHISILERLSNDSSEKVRCYITFNVNCTANLLDKLSFCEENHIRYYVSRHKNCSIKTLERLCKDNCTSVRQTVVLNKKCNKSILDCLSKDENKEVRFLVALNENSSKETLIKLYKEFPDIVSKHKRCPNFLKTLSL